MRSALTTVAEVAGVACIGFAFGLTIGLIVLGVALIGGGIFEGRRA